MRSLAARTTCDRAGFEERGYAVIPHLFSGEALVELRTAIEEVQAWPERPGGYMQYFETSSDGSTRLLHRIENFEPFHAALAGVMRGPKLQGVVSELLGEPAILFKDKLNLKLPGGGGFEPHQDSQAGWGDYAELFVTAAVAIDEASPDNGCLELAEWPHRRELIGPLWKPLEAEALRELRFVALPMLPGDAVFFDSFLPHRSAPNRSGGARRLLYVTYNRASAGDHRARYYADKRASYPPDCERNPDRAYVYRV